MKEIVLRWNRVYVILQIVLYLSMIIKLYLITF
jgi:hypothetical protein